MIIITDLKFIQVDRDPYELVSLTGPYEGIEVLSERGDTVVSATELRELIRGRRFVRPSDMTDVVIGLDKDTQDLLGLQYEAWENLQKQSDSYARAYNDTLDTLGKMKKANLLQRIKWVFTGVK